MSASCKKKLTVRIAGVVLGGALIMQAGGGCGGSVPSADHAHNVAAGVTTSR
jgi:hypothetical protein